MHEQHKIDEAEYFLGRMAVSEHVLKDLTYNLSAFLSASRSALQYALREARKTPNGEVWYKSQIDRWPLVAFLKAKRDVSIHSQPVRPAQRIIIKSKRKDLSASLSNGPSRPASVEISLGFDGMRTHHELITTCQEYLDAIRAIVADGRERGFLSG